MGKLPLASRHPVGIIPTMINERIKSALSDAVEAFRPKGGLKRAAAEAGITHDIARGIVGGRSSKVDIDSAIALGHVVGVDVVNLIDSLSRPAAVSIAGKVGAGAQVPLVDAYEKGDGPQVECPPQLSPHGIVAVEVEGDSMEPVYSQGDLLFYSRDAVGVPDEAIGARCVCEDMDGNAWVKQVKPGREPGTFDLHSINAKVDPMWGVRLKWAARVRLHLPADLAKKVG